ncbi:MAG TPA: hypothetical protein VJR27_03410 [Candidatus Saccharimonadales bacterium]|nr:hypothetical protein [Candidatus Saccharimonadales bacterium]
MSEQLGEIPMTVYANQRDKNGELLSMSHYDKKTATQIEPETFRALGGHEDYRAFHDSLIQRGVRGIIVANHHLTRAGVSLDDRLKWKEVLQSVKETGTQVCAMHAEFGRIDAKHDADKTRSMQELDAVLQGPEAIGHTLMGEVLAEGYSLWASQHATNLLPKRRIEEKNAAMLRVEESFNNDMKMPARMAACFSDPAVAQHYTETRYIKELHESQPELFVATEVPYDALVKHRETELSRDDFISMTRDIGQSLNTFFDDLPRPILV